MKGAVMIHIALLKISSGSNPSKAASSFLHMTTRPGFSVLLAALTLGVSTLVGCASACQTEAFDAALYSPKSGPDWKTSTPEAQGLDQRLVNNLYRDASKLETLYGVLIVKNGYLVAEEYFHEGSIDQLSGRMSATKSVTSALTGIALQKGCLSSLDEKMMTFFPEFAGQIQDPRKSQITIRQLLQMRSGYPWEEREPPYLEKILMSENWHFLPHIIDVPLTNDPGAEFKYSNLGSHILGVATARACKTDLRTFARKNLFSPIGVEIGNWTTDADNNYWGYWELYLRARDMAKFGLLYLNNGQLNGQQVVPAAWVRDSLQPYSKDINFTGWISSKLGHHMRDLGYGYQWWSASSGKHKFDFAWGHGGQLIVLLHDLNMVIVTTADPLYHFPGEAGWKHEGAIIDVVGKFIASLPGK
jgi:CubicO group peptidase (beta-lactamase class C family)